MPGSAASLKQKTKTSSHDRILGAAKHLFASRGYESTSTAAIARAAGTSESQLMKHFGSKEGLLEAILERGWEHMNTVAQGILVKPVSPLAKLNLLTDVLLRTLEQDGDLKVLMLLEGRRIRGEAHMVVVTRGFRGFVRLIDALLREMRRAGVLRRDLHPEAVRSALIGAYEGLLRDQLLAERIGFPARYRARHTRALFAAMWAGFLNKKPGRRR
jgi:AcrR family transcriptional regulator